MASGAGQELPTGHGDLGGFWGSWGGQPALLPHIPSTYPALHCYGWLPSPAHTLLTQPVSAPPELPRHPLLLPGSLLYSPFAPPGPAEDPSRAKAAAAAASRESTAALKAWLGRHLKNPYPSKGEKVLLALVSRMSLTQVSTWFANARRRLKKERRASWPPQEAAGVERAAAPSAKQLPASSAPAPWRKAADGRGASPAELRPKIWRVAELVTGAPGAGRAAGPPSGVWRGGRRRASPVPGQAAGGSWSTAEKRGAGPGCTCGQLEASESHTGGKGV